MTSSILPYVLLTLPLVLFVLVAYLLLAVYTTLRRDLRDLRRATDASAAGAGISPQVHASLQEMLTELRKTADQIGQDLTLRSAVLQRQIDEADRKLALLDTQLKALRLAESTPPRKEAPPPAAPVEPPARAPRPTPTATRADNGPSRTAEPASEFRPVELRELNKYQTVLQLAEEGLDSLEIARRTRLGREEVELLLGLRDEGRGG